MHSTDKVANLLPPEKRLFVQGKPRLIMREWFEYLAQLAKPKQKTDKSKQTAKLSDKPKNEVS